MENVEALTARLDDKWAKALLTGATPIAFFVRAEDLGEIVRWVGATSDRLRYRGTVVVGLGPQQVYRAGKVVIARAEDMPAIRAGCLERGIGPDLAELGPGECWLLAWSRPGEEATDRWLIR